MSHFGLPTTLQPAPSTVKKAKKRVPRPSNCFIAYRMAAHRSILQQRPNINSKEVSQIVGKMWKNEPENIKDHFRAIANQMKEEHASRYPDYSYNPKRRTSDPVIMNGEPTNEAVFEETTMPMPYDATRRPARQTTSSYSQASSLASSQATSSQATSDYDYQEDINIRSQCTVINSSTVNDDIWQKFESKAYPEDDSFDATNDKGCDMDYEDGTLTFSTSSSASNSSSQVNLQEYHIGYEPAMDCGIYVDTAAVHPLSTKWWHEPDGSPSPASGAISLPLEALTGGVLQYIPSLDNFDYGAF
ncbi:hypothetical protein INT44_009233 [Umbelopsis vinacea]|uniref:HMG box domain-containing protein n=1 Tax=Umbelopsis vinacea TaxID=44442 RepID=A0A8H7Q1J9_9FUNG|nr:hypothetical protein INT44_009233 [Umbelopsis vinacea]